jgi:heterodisulfide reductase subunit A
MDNRHKIGVYICHCGHNIAGVIDIPEVFEYAKNLSHVYIVRDFDYMCSNKGYELIGDDIKKLGINRIVIAGCSPRLYEQSFQNVLKKAGLNPQFLQIANIREQCAWLHEPGLMVTEKVKRLLNGAVRRVVHHSPAEARLVPVSPATLVLGGGVAGIQAALEIAASNHTVYLVEKEPNIGGHMVQFDKTFPVLDCTVCILNPKMREVLNNSYIHLMTYSEVVGISGYVGNFTVKVKRKARYVDEGKCIGCGICQEKCPSITASEFDARMGLRKAIYTPFLQAIPNVPVIDEENCYHFLEGKDKCSICSSICESQAIDYQQKDTYLDLQVGSIIVATGFTVFDPTQIPQYGYARLPNVFTSLEFERLCSPSGPTMGRLRLADGRDPKSVAIIHCVGSRDKNYREYCSRVCCMQALKYSHIFKEATGGDVYQIYTDMCCPGKGYEEFHQRVKSEPVNIIRGKVLKISGNDSVLDQEERMVVTYEDFRLGKLLNISVDMVILCLAIEPQHDAEQIGKMLHLGHSSDGFFMERHPKLDPVGTMSEGIFIVGCCQGPKDIPETISQASAAAARVLTMIIRGTIETGAITATINENICSGCKICQSLCPYGAIYVDEASKVLRINHILCKGCNVCGAACPSSAISTQNFSATQIIAEIEGILA